MKPKLIIFTCSCHRGQICYIDADSRCKYIGGGNTTPMYWKMAGDIRPMDSLYKEVTDIKTLVNTVLTHLT